MRASRLIAAAAAALFAPLAWPLAIGRVFWFDDLTNLHIPLRHLYQQALASGDSLLWTPAIFSGFYLHGEGQIGLLHPWHLVLYRLLPLTLAINLEFTASYAAALAGMYWLLRRLGARPSAAVFGAMTFACGTFLVLHRHHLNLVAVAAHLPWLLAALDVLATASTRRSRASAYAAVALLLGSQILLGFPQSVWLNLLAAAVFTIARTASVRRLWPLGAAAAAVFTGVLIGGVQLLPTLETAQLSLRPLLGSGFSGTLSLHPANLIQLVSPYVLALRVYNPAEYPFLHEYAVYPSAALIVLPFWLVVRWRELGDRRRPIVVCLVAAAVALVLALGRYGGVNELLGSLPGLRWLRAPTRYVFLFHVGLVICAALAFDDLQSVSEGTAARPARLWPLWIPAVLSAIVTGAVSLHVVHAFPKTLLASAAQAAIGPVLFVAATTLVALAARGRRAAPALLVVLTAIDLGRSGMYEIYREPPRTIASIAAALPDPPEAEARVFVGPGVVATDALALKPFRLTSEYVALEPATYIDPASDVGLRLAGTAWRWKPGAPLERVADPLPRARLLAVARYVPIGRAGDVRGVQLQFLAVDVARTAVVDRVLPALAGPPGRAKVVTDRPGLIVVNTDASGAQVLALTERFHEGWRATVGGQPVETLRVHGDFLGCVVPAGAQRVEFSFRPRSLTKGLLVTAIGVGLLALGVAVLYRE